MASFQVKIRGKTLRKRENKNYRSVSFLPDAKQKIQKKKKKKFKKLKNTIMASFQAKIDWGRPRKREKKIIVPIRSVQTHNLKFKKNS